MGDQKLEIAVVLVMLIFPMFIGLVYEHRMLDNISYSIDNGKALPLGSVNYMIYSSTTLIYTASILYALSTLLVPPATLLYSFMFAHDLVRDCYRAAISNLPSPLSIKHGDQDDRGSANGTVIVCALYIVEATIANVVVEKALVVRLPGR